MLKKTVAVNESCFIKTFKKPKILKRCKNTANKAAIIVITESTCAKLKEPVALYINRDEAEVIMVAAK